MNCQELATIFIEKLDVKCFIMNNQHLGMVVQWEDRFYKKNRAHTYLGHRVRALSALLHTLSLHKCSLWQCAPCNGHRNVSRFLLLVTYSYSRLGMMWHMSCVIIMVAVDDYSLLLMTNGCCDMQDAEWHLTNEVKDIYPDFVKMAESFSVPAKRILRPEELRPAIRYLHCKVCCTCKMKPAL